MRVKLFTRRGEFIVEGTIPPCTELPDVIIWGERLFVTPAIEGDVRAAEPDAAGFIAYIEALAVALGAKLGSEE